MRTLDRPLPLIALDDVPTIAHWPVRPVIALEAKEPYHVWDAGEVWDDENLVWDDQWRDATCAWTGMEIDPGQPDEANLYPAARCVIQLDNRDGTWSGFNEDGTSAQFGPGRTLNVWGHRPTWTDRTFGEGNFGDETFGGDDRDWWLFAGKIARYDHRSDGTIEIEAFDSLSDLAQEIGTYTPGAAGNKPQARLEAVLAAAGLSALPHRFALGTVALTAQETDQAPLEEMQVVCGSDGNVMFVDADGTLLSFDRTWRAGREDQPEVPVVSANVCSAQFVVWDAVLTTNDEGLADRVVLENVAGLQAVAGAAGGYVWTQTEQQWTGQAEGDALAALILHDNSERTMAIEEFDLYLLDPLQPEIWKAVGWRRLDRMRFRHDQVIIGGILQLDITTLITSLMHTITPDGWVMTVGTSKVTTYELPILYDTGLLHNTTEEYGY